MIRKALPIAAGAGEIRFLGHSGPAQYAIEGDPSRLRPGTTRLRGSITVSADTADLAFRAGEGVLVLESGERVRMVMLAYSAGGTDVFIEVRA